MSSAASPAQSSSRPTGSGAQQNKADTLVLQDPQAYDLATQPQLRPSLETRPESSVPAEREKWRQLWEQFDADPQHTADKLQERQQLLRTSELQRRELEILKQRSSDLDAALQTAHHERFHHPLVYGGAAGLVAMAGLWLLERRRRIGLEEKALQADAQAEMQRQEQEHQDQSRGDSMLDLYEDDTTGWPDIARDFAVDLNGTAETSPADGVGPSVASEALEMGQDGERVTTVKDPLADPDITKPSGIEQAVGEAGVQAAAVHAAAPSQPRAGAGADPGMDHLLELRTMLGGLLALDRPEDAVLLLKTHIELEPQTCAWAHLECMQLLERLGQREGFDELREQYRAQFNRMPPSWQEPNAHVLGLDGYSRASVELCNAWSQGAPAARQLIAAWMLGPLVGRKFVQLPAFHDLLDLYEMLEWVPGASDSPQDGSAATVWAAALADQADAVDAQEPAEFLPTVSLLDLDYEFPSDLTLQKDQAEMAEKTVTVVKPGEFSLDFNLEGTATQGLFSQPAALSEK